MAHVYFHCSNSRGCVLEQYSAAVGNLTEARDHAAGVIRSLVMGTSAEDWRDWILCVRDDLDDEIFAVPFASLLGKPH